MLWHICYSPFLTHLLSLESILFFLKSFDTCSSILHLLSLILPYFQFYYIIGSPLFFLYFLWSILLETFIRYTLLVDYLHNSFISPLTPFSIFLSSVVLIHKHPPHSLKPPSIVSIFHLQHHFPFSEFLHSFDSLFWSPYEISFNWTYQLWSLSSSVSCLHFCSYVHEWTQRAHRWGDLLSVISLTLSL